MKVRTNAEQTRNGLDTNPKVWLINQWGIYTDEIHIQDGKKGDQKVFVVKIAEGVLNINMSIF